MLDPEFEAQRILNSMWNQNEFPVDPVTISRKIGVQVLDTDLPESVSGALIKEHGKDPIIALHRYDHPNRKRFSCAHELGHYISRIQSNDDSSEYEYVDLRSHSAANVTDQDEVFAKQFAASLLMPREAVKELGIKVCGHLHMALYFGVSPEVMKNRLKNIGFRTS